MHECPRCGQACDCSGDIDDSVSRTDEWVWEHCVCPCGDDDEPDDGAEYLDDE